MVKVNFSKVEDALEEARRKLLIEYLNELGTIANLIQNSHNQQTVEEIKKIIEHFQAQLKLLKQRDVKLYQKLELSPADEARFMLSNSSFTTEDWLRVKTLKVKIDELKTELYGETIVNDEHEKQIQEERIKHKNKRFNIREDWLPLH